MAKRPKHYEQLTGTPNKPSRRRESTAAKDDASGSSRTRVDVHEAVTQKIVAAIEAGAGEFQMPWHRPGLALTIPKNAATEKAYRGSNILAVDRCRCKALRAPGLGHLQAIRRNRRPGAQGRKRVSHRQIRRVGAEVRRGCARCGWSSWKRARPRQDWATEAPARKPSEARRGWRRQCQAAVRESRVVFNIDQVDAPAELRAKLLPASAPRPDLTVRLGHVDAFIAATGAEFREGGQRAFYRHRDSKGDGDFIQMPPRDLFTGTATSTPTEAFESTRLHELTHWVGAAHRLNRTFGERFGDKAYAFEELVAELSSAFLCAELQISNTPRIDHAQYCASWLEVLKGDDKAIFTAASLATRAVAYLNDLQPKTMDAAPDNVEQPDVGVPQRPASNDSAGRATPSKEPR